MGWQQRKPYTFCKISNFQSIIARKLSGTSGSKFSEIGHNAMHFVWLNDCLVPRSRSHVVTQTANWPLSPLQCWCLWVGVQKPSGKCNIDGREEEGYVFNSFDALHLLFKRSVTTIYDRGCSEAKNVNKDPKVSGIWEQLCTFWAHNFVFTLRVTKESLEKVEREDVEEPG